tara:strand:+ start:266 stop:520 length:255 start_codon:yes stop_codon:yes gene_type:complete
VKWAKQTTAENTKRFCSTCEEYPDAIPAIESILELISKGKVKVSVTQIHKYLQENFDYQIGLSGLQNHVNRCETKLWEKCRKRK